MPPQKKRTYRRRRATKQGYHPYVYASAPAVGWVAARAAQIVAKKYLNSEKKFNDRTGSPQPDNSTGTLILLNNLAQGVGHDDRVGTSIRMTSVFVQGRLNKNASASATTVRLALVLDRQPNGVAPTYSSSSGGSGIWEDASVDSWRDLGNNKRFIILRSFRMNVDSDDPEKPFTMKAKIPYRLGKVSYYPDVLNGTITDIATGALFFVMFSDEATNTPTVNYRSRVRYIDN